MASEQSYEQQLKLVTQLQRSPSATDRTIAWSEGNGPLGVARSPEGRIEIFIAGPMLKPRSKIVQENLEHQTWYRDGEQPPLLANRLLLPAAGHFDQVAAFLCTELLRNGVVADASRAFGLTEPVIELAIQRLRIADETILGLTGELLLLEALVRSAPDKEVEAVLRAWKGYRETARDFQLGVAGVEVKTTTGSTSSHQVQGVHQVEPGHGVDGAPESALLLVSIGIQWVGDSDATMNATSLPVLVDAIIERAEQALHPGADPVIAQLLARIAEYGSATEIGYDHETMGDALAFRRSLRAAFVRCYDMADERISVLRGDDVRARPNVETDSVRYRINLPDQVRGDLNPVVGLNDSAKRILELAGEEYR